MNILYTNSFTICYLQKSSISAYSTYAEDYRFDSATHMQRANCILIRLYLNSIYKKVHKHFVLQLNTVAFLTHSDIGAIYLDNVIII